MLTRPSLTSHGTAATPKDRPHEIPWSNWPPVMSAPWREWIKTSSCDCNTSVAPAIPAANTAATRTLICPLNCPDSAFSTYWLNAHRARRSLGLAGQEHPVAVTHANSRSTPITPSL